MAMARCIGKMGASTRANGKEEFNMEKEKFMFLVKGTRRESLKKMF